MPDPGEAGGSRAELRSKTTLRRKDWTPSARKWQSPRPLGLVLLAPTAEPRDGWPWVAERTHRPLPLLQGGWANGYPAPADSVLRGNLCPHGSPKGEDDASKGRSWEAGRSRSMTRVYHCYHESKHVYGGVYICMHGVNVCICVTVYTCICMCMCVNCVCV